MVVVGLLGPKGLGLAVDAATAGASKTYKNSNKLVAIFYIILQNCKNK
jgi:hypothetical protein